MLAHDDWGVAEGWWATDGSWRSLEPATRRALHHATGAPEHPEGPPEGPPRWFVRYGEGPRLHSPATIALDGGGSLEAHDRLPVDLPLGAHELHPADDGPTTSLFVVPERAPRPRRGWGWSAQLYGARSGRSWGHGDLADLADLAAWARRGGAELLAHNPLGAPLPVAHQEPSPYSASTRRFWSPLYLHVEGVTAAELAAGPVSAAAAAGRTLNERRSIDRDEVWRLKLAALDAIWAAPAARARVDARLEAAHGDRELARYATFCALAEHFGHSWQQWPAEYRHPDGDAVARFGRQHPDRVAFHRWLQLELDDQLDRAASAGAALMADLAVGFDPGGFDAWHDQELLAPGCSVGAPPDDLAPQGQDWGLPPYVPWRLRVAAYRPWIDTLRRTFRHCGALRIDHVMGLFRLFWIPAETPEGDGGYVYHRGTEMLDLAVMEAARAGAVLVGEDLGTVEDEVRDALSARDVFGYRIGWFADEPPAQWPATTLASLTTHDLPTVAGLWSGQDTLDREAAGRPPDPEGDRDLRAHLERLVTTDRSGEDSPVEELGTREVVLRAHEALASGGSDLAVATLEDAVGEQTRPNLPGTVDEHPNWRRALAVPIERLDEAGAAEIAATMRAGRPN